MQLLESSSVFFSISYLYTMFEFELHLLYKYFLNNDIYTKNNTKFSIRGTKDKKVLYLISFVWYLFIFFLGHGAVFFVLLFVKVSLLIYFLWQSPRWQQKAESAHSQRSRPYHLCTWKT